MQNKITSYFFLYRKEQEPNSLQNIEEGQSQRTDMTQLQVKESNSSKGSMILVKERLMQHNKYPRDVPTQT